MHLSNERSKGENEPQKAVPLASTSGPKCLVHRLADTLIGMLDAIHPSIKASHSSNRSS